MIDKKRLDGLLFAILGDQTLVDRWWASPNKSFEMVPPQLVFEDNPERIRDYILRAANLGGDYC